MSQGRIQFGTRAVVMASLSVALVMLLSGGASAAHVAGPTIPTIPTATPHPGGGAPEQWAFGGSESLTYTCGNATCLGETLPNETFSFTLHYYLEWVVIYTLTNISSNQTQIEGQAALNLSASYSLSECIVVTSSEPCQSTSLSINLGGSETENGFTNVTNGTVVLTPSGGTPGSVAALAIMNAASHAGFNFSGSYSVQSQNESIGNLSVGFDAGASESSAISFGKPLGVVPLDPAPGDNWTANSSYSSTGSVHYGYSFSATEDGVPVSESNWTDGSAAGSGTLTVNGTDLGAFTLYDNYTTPPSQVTAQEIELEFGSGNFSGSDGWILVPDLLYGGVIAGFDDSRAVAPPVGIHPGTDSIAVSSAETAYYHEGSGFIGAAEAGNTSLPGGALGDASVNLKAGPEPVSVAQQQYSAITAKSTSNSALPLDLLLGAAVVAVVVVGVGLVVWRRSVRRRKPPTQPPTPYNAGVPPPSSPPLR